MLWFAGALRAVEPDSNEARGQRIRYASVHEQCAQLQQAFAHAGPVNQAVFSPDESRVATASDDRAARVWTTLTGRPAMPPLTHRREVRRVAFSPDGHRVVTACDDHTARVWDAANGDPLTPPLPHNGAVSHAAFAPDSLRFVTSSYDGHARVWRLVMDPHTGEDRSLLARVLSGRRVEGPAGLVPLPAAALGESLAELKTRCADYFSSSPSANPERR